MQHSNLKQLFLKQTTFFTSRPSIKLKQCCMKRDFFLIVYTESLGRKDNIMLIKYVRVMSTYAHMYIQMHVQYIYTPILVFMQKLIRSFRSRNDLSITSLSNTQEFNEDSILQINKTKAILEFIISRRITHMRTCYGIMDRVFSCSILLSYLIKQNKLLVKRLLSSQ